MYRSVPRTHRFALGLLALGLLLAFANPLSADEKSYIRGYYAIIAKEADLSAEQREQFNTALAARAKALDDFDAANKSKMDELAANAKKARAEDNTELYRELQAQLRPLRAERRKIEDSHRDKAMAVFTPEQLQRVQAYGLYVGAAIKFSKAELSDEQKAKIKTIAIELGQSIKPDAPGKEVKKVREALYERVAEEVLTAAQRDKLVKKGSQ